MNSLKTDPHIMPLSMKMRKKIEIKINLFKEIYRLELGDIE